MSISPDAVTYDRPSDKVRADQVPAGENDTSEPPNQDLVYAARISLDSTKMQVEERLVDLSPGMAVTVEIKTGSRRIISYLFSPLLALRQEALRER
jgi:membrane fusion protein, hemolysin D